MIIVETDRLILRRFHLLDTQAMHRVFGDPDVMRYGDGIQTEAWVRDWLRQCLETHYPQWGFGPWAVVDKQRREALGYCGLFYFPDVCGQPEIEIGYRLARAFWGRGYATEAVLAVRDYGFDTLCLPRLIAMIDPHNTASIRVAEKAGIHYEKDVMFAGYSHPDRVYAVTRPAVTVVSHRGDEQPGAAGQGH